MHHQTPLFLALRLFVQRLKMPLEGLRFVKMLATFEIMNSTDSHIQNITRVVCFS